MDPENRWVRKAAAIPWEAIEEKYTELFPSDTGMPAKPLRTALRSLIIQTQCRKVHKTAERSFWTQPAHPRTSYPQDVNLLNKARKNLEKMIDRKTKYADNADRVEVERSFSLAKRCCGLGRMMKKLDTTTRSFLYNSSIGNSKKEG